MSNPDLVTTGGEGRWLHSDWKVIAYHYNYKLFQKFVEIGGLSQ
jgi:hypothetical protein